MMNKFSIILSSIAIVSASLISCDVEDDPFAHVDGTVSDLGDPAFNDTVWNDTTFDGQMIVIEDFTGHRCPNCPKGTDLAKMIINDNPDNVMVVALHNSDNFSKPKPPTFLAEYETVTGENLRLDFDLNAFPIGMINRIDFQGNDQRGTSIDLWEDRINQLLNDPAYMSPSLTIDFMTVYNTENRLLRVFPKVDVLEPITGEVYLGVYVLENGIISPQEDNRANPPIIDDYEHNHLLRAGFEQNDIGTKIFESPQAGAVYRNDTLATADVVINDGWNADALEVVVYTYNRDSKEIIQASRVALKP